MSSLLLHVSFFQPMIFRMGVAISADGLSKTYRTYKKQEGIFGALKGLIAREYEKTHAAKSVTFEIEEGEFVGFLGPNGAGKTTVLKMLSGLLVPTSGTARVLGYIPWERKAPFKRQFSLVLGQKNSLWWDLPAHESLELNRAIYEIDDVSFKKVVDQLADLLEVRDKLNVMVRELSLGERMKMELIAALIHRPKVLFLDEPTIGLDVVSQKRVRDFLRFYSEENKISTILTSHYMQDIEELCRRVIIIDHGQVFFDGELSEIIEKFAGYKLLQFIFPEPPSCTFDLGEVVERTRTSVRLKVQRDKVTEVCRRILSNCEVQDFSVEEEPIEEIIRQVFHDHSAAEQRAGREIAPAVP
ncbi:MAG TPA: ATP-binding cassette domain-containing protein [Chthoniobacterales bacterium]|nr:ATP-binding cassette domain-containing protein [Chthoniobacterales bacterium]